MGLAIIAVLPVGAWSMRTLEQRFPAPAGLPAHVDGIIVLGGSVDQVATAETGQPEVNAAAERLMVIPDLARRYPDARIIFSGGSGELRDPDEKEAPVARAALEEIGMDIGRVTFEGESRNTWENALFSRDLMHPQPGQTWLLVTSAFHMPRSVGIFRHVGWPVVAYPVDIRAPRTLLCRPDFDLLRGLELLSQSVHEYIGLVAYRLLGRTDSLFPAPDTAEGSGKGDGATKTP
ncbi:YdcF family protein [Nitrospirillum viridazoti]|uniref:YdcF family protein n=1 Tax=Nitrospirillum viridazoti TaxID=3144925 RepID=UPI001FCFFC21|nr:YdcF family protein [Nitrospirillum amazonense]